MVMGLNTWKDGIAINQGNVMCLACYVFPINAS